MKTLIAAVVLSLLMMMLAFNIMGCGEETAFSSSSSPASTPSLTPISTNIPMSTLASTPGPTLTPIIVPTPVSTLTSALSAESGPMTTPTPALISTFVPTVLFLQVTEPQDGSERNAGVGLISGKTVPAAVVSIFVNGDIVLANVSEVGDFSAEVVFEEGPNILEVLASDQQGNSEYSRLVVIGIP